MHRTTLWIWTTPCTMSHIWCSTVYSMSSHSTVYSISSLTLICMLREEDGISCPTIFGEQLACLTLGSSFCLVVEMLGVNWPSLPGLDVVELDDGGNAIKCPTTAPALLAPVYLNSNVLYSSSPFRRYIGKWASFFEKITLTQLSRCTSTKARKVDWSICSGISQSSGGVEVRTEEDVKDICSLFHHLN